MSRCVVQAMAQTTQDEIDIVWQKPILGLGFEDQNECVYVPVLVNIRKLYPGDQLFYTYDPEAVALFNSIAKKLRKRRITDVTAHAAAEEQQRGGIAAEAKPSADLAAADDADAESIA